jgi:uncharacterized membrane protein YidH (DUF202 family)
METYVGQAMVMPTPTLSVSTLWLGFLVVLGLFAIISAVLLYHWNKYAFDRRASQRAIAIYFSVSGVFILLIVVSLLSLTF